MESNDEKGHTRPIKGSVQLYRVITTPFILSLDEQWDSREGRLTREGEGIRIDSGTSNTAAIRTTSEAVGTTVVGTSTCHGTGEDEVKEARVRHGYRGGVG